ncbi:MAG: cohesin domain-containing protein [Bacteroidota bacterium]
MDITGNITNPKIATLSFVMPGGESTDINFLSFFISKTDNTGCLISDVAITNTSYTAPSFSITGFIDKQNDIRRIPDVTVKAESQVAIQQDLEAVTTSLGEFSFDLFPQTDYIISFEKTGVIGCGVSVGDFNATQQHIRLAKDFLEPEQHIAADLTGDDKITNSDLIKIQKIILGTIGVGEVDSWRFITQSSFNSLVLPVINEDVPSFQSTQTYNLSSNKPFEIFFGIKMGDVSSSGCSDLSGKLLKQEGSTTEKILISKMSATKGQYLKIPVYVSNFNGIISCNLSLQFDREAFELIDIENGALDIIKDDFTINHDRKGIFNMLWFNMEQEGKSVKENVPLFYVNLKALKRFTNIEELVSLDYERVENSIYTYKGEVEPLQLSFIDPSFSRSGLKSGSTNQLAIFPNPFNDQINITFNANSVSPVLINLFNKEGKLLKQYKQTSEIGRNQITISDLNKIQNHFIFYEVILEEQIIRGKLTKVN